MKRLPWTAVADAMKPTPKGSCGLGLQGASGTSHRAPDLCWERGGGGSRRATVPSIQLLKTLRWAWNTKRKSSTTVRKGLHPQPFPSHLFCFFSGFGVVSSSCSSERFPKEMLKKVLSLGYHVRESSPYRRETPPDFLFVNTADTPLQESSTEEGLPPAPM